jgi:ABC-type glycerol-3-phosphate transport system substrate-binding protein
MKMKKVLILFLFLMAAAGFAAPIKLLLVNTGFSPWAPGEETGGYQSYQHRAVGEFMAANPNIQVTMIARDVTQGSLTVDALMAKGTPPDVWLDAGGYFTKYLNSGYALPLEKYLNVAIYQQDLLGPYTRNGHVYALPSGNVATGMAVNLDMLKAIGYTLPAQKDWTTEEFVRLSEKLKAAGILSTMIMTKQGWITWDMVWLYAFGAELYKNFDHSKVTINSPQAKVGLEYVKMLVDKGYAWPYPNETNDDMGVDLFTTGKVFSCMLQNGHTDYWLPEQIKQGRLDKLFEMTFIEFPHVAGREHTPVYAYQTMVMAHASKDEERNKAIALLVDNQAGRKYQEASAVNGGGMMALNGIAAPNRGMAAKESYKAIAKLASTAGLMDLGDMEPRAEEIEAAWKLPIQDFMDGKITAQQVLDKFEAEAKKILARK